MCPGLKCVSGVCEIRNVICFLTAENLSVLDVHKWLQNVYRVNMMPECTVHLWVHIFHKEKQETIYNNE